MKVSIIVPVYNTEKYLHECIDSILSQFHTDFELVLVDDGSTDSSPVIIDDYARQDSRIRAVHKPNGGVSSARNVGLDYCSSDYVVFCDSDDVLGPGYLSDLLRCNSFEPDSSTFTISCLTTFSPDDKEPDSTQEDCSICLDHGTMQHFLDLVDNYLIYSPCCKLFRKEILDKNNIRFDESLKSAEDLDFNLRYIRHISYINIVSHSQYYYRIGYKGHRNTPIQDSDINSMHLIAQGLIELAERMGIYSDAEAYLAKRIAEKHWLSRLPYVFIIKKENPFSRRWAKYKEMRGNRQYNKLCKAGAKHLPISKFSKLLIRFDNFFLWSCYYAMVRILKNKTR